MISCDNGRYRIANCITPEEKRFAIAVKQPQGAPFASQAQFYARVTPYGLRSLPLLCRHLCCDRAAIALCLVPEEEEEEERNGSARY